VSRWLTELESPTTTGQLSPKSESKKQKAEMLCETISAFCFLISDFQEDR